MEGKLTPLDNAIAQRAGELYQRNSPVSHDAFSQGLSPREAKLWDVSKGFEAMFLNQLFKAMRKTIHESEFSKPSAGRKIFTEFLDAEYAKIASGKSSSSLAGMVYRQLVQNHEGAVPRLPNFDMSSGPAAISAAYTGLSKNKTTLNEHSLDPIISEASEQYGIEANLIRSVIRQESGFQPYAVSKAGAKGLMQLMDETARDMGVNNVYDPRENIMGGVRYLRYLRDRYDGDEKKTLAAYNAGPSQVDKYKGIPPFAETQHYVSSVLALKERLEQSAGETYEHTDAP